jgi:hypothetical protein
MHGSNARNLSVELSLSEVNKHAMSFLLSLMFSIQQNWRRGQNRFCLEVRGFGERRRVWGAAGRDGPNNISTNELMKSIKIK